MHTWDVVLFAAAALAVHNKYQVHMTPAVVAM